MAYKIYCYNCEKEIPAHCFFILCKGLNSGKPLQAPCPNSFVFQCSDEKERDFYFTLCFGLWKAKAFHPHLCGSVIEFIRIREFKAVMEAAAGSLVPDGTGFAAAVEKVKSIEEKEKLIRLQLQKLAQLKIALLRQFLK